MWSRGGRNLLHSDCNAIRRKRMLDRRPAYEARMASLKAAYVLSRFLRCR